MRGNAAGAPWCVVWPVRSRVVVSQNQEVHSVFGSIHSAGRDAVLSGNHAVERSPEITGRWGTSIVLLPSAGLADALTDLTATAAAVIGGEHWRSGSAGRAHITARALEPHGPVPPDRLDRYAAALERVATTAKPPTLRFTGLCVSPGTVMACALPADDGADNLREHLELELDDDGWFERKVFGEGRDPIWYVSILHFAGPVLDADRLIQWVDANRSREIGHQTFEEMSLCEWEFDGVAMAPKVLTTTGFGVASHNH